MSTKSFIVSMAVVLIACGSDSKQSKETINNTSNTTETVNQPGDNKQNSTTEPTTEDKANNSDELTDEYLLSLPETPADDFDYIEIEGGLSITKYNGGENIVIIPAQINGVNVVKIDIDAFSYGTIKAVVTGKNVHTIDGGEIKGGAFEACKYLTKVVINGPVTYIGGNAFSRTALESINLPDTLKTIKDDAFHNTKIKSIEIPGSVEFIGYQAFSNNDLLEDVVVNEGTIEIMGGVFSECSNLKRVTLPNSLTKIKKTVFEGSENVTIIAPAGSKAEEFAKANGINVENN